MFFSLSVHVLTSLHNHPLSQTFMTSLSWYFFILSQVIVFEEQEADGKIQLTSSPDYGMTVDVEWWREVRGEACSERDEGWVAGEDPTRAAAVSSVYIGTDTQLQPAALKKRLVSEHDILCSRRRLPTQHCNHPPHSSFPSTDCIYDILLNLCCLV